MAEPEKNIQNRDTSAARSSTLHGIITSLWVCGSVCINDIVLYDAIMREFFNHSETSPVCDSSCPAELNHAPLRRKAGGGKKTQPAGADRRQDVQQLRVVARFLQRLSRCWSCDHGKKLEMKKTKIFQLIGITKPGPPAE